MIERDISVAEVRAALESGEIIEEYLADAPPLVLGWITSRPLHVVAEDDPLTEEITAVTVYEPDRKLWKSGFRVRKKR